MATSPEDTARQVLEVVPLVMRTIRRELRSHRSAELSLPQFRTLAYLSRQSDVSLSEVAEHIGLTLPSMSKLVDGLVTRGLVTRTADRIDRRRVVLCLTEEGLASMQAALQATEAYLAELLARLSDGQRADVSTAMDVLRPIFLLDSRSVTVVRAEGNPRSEG
jgi:DNA-binding MarR family transcriptional regulator